MIQHLRLLLCSVTCRCEFPQSGLFSCPSFYQVHTSYLSIDHVISVSYVVVFLIEFIALCVYVFDLSDFFCVRVSFVGPWGVFWTAVPCPLDPKAV